MVHYVSVVLAFLAFFVIIAVKETAHEVFLSASMVALVRAAAPPLRSYVSRMAAAFAESTGAGTTRHLYLVYVSVGMPFKRRMPDTSFRKTARTSGIPLHYDFRQEVLCRAENGHQLIAQLAPQPARTLEEHPLFEVSLGPVPLEHVAGRKLLRCRPCAAHSSDRARSPDTMCSRPSGSTSFQPDAISREHRAQR
jgi:hypothetical protein